MFLAVPPLKEALRLQLSKKVPVDRAVRGQVFSSGSRCFVPCMSSSLAPFVFFAGWFFERWSPQPRFVTAPCECFCDCEGTGRAGLYFYLLVGAFGAIVLDRVCRKVASQVRSIATQPPRRRPDLADAARSFKVLNA